MERSDVWEWKNTRPIHGADWRSWRDMGLSQRDSSPGHGSSWSSRGITTRPITLRPIRHRQFDKVLPSCSLPCPDLSGKTRETLDQSRLAMRCSTCHTT